jgi:hypothetical protein
MMTLPLCREIVFPDRAEALAAAQAKADIRVKWRLCMGMSDDVDECVVEALEALEGVRIEAHNFRWPVDDLRGSKVNPDGDDDKGV